MSFRPLPLRLDQSDSDYIECMLNEIYNYSKNEILKIKQNLDVIYGSNSSEKKKSMSQLYEQWKMHTTSFFEDVVYESEKDKNQIIKDIEGLLLEKKVLEKELQMNISIDEYNDNVPLIDAQIYIESVLQSCKTIKIERTAELHKLQEEEKEICQSLNEKPKYSGITDLPSASLLISIRNYLIDLKSTQTARWKIFLKEKVQVQSLFKDLEETPTSEFDKLVLSDSNKFQLSKSNLNELQKLIQRLEDKTENQKCIAVELRTKLNSLWDRLQIDVTFRQNFVCTQKGYGKTVINELKKEIKRCETLKRENIKQFIEQLRFELNDLWNKCYFSERQKNQFHACYKTEVDEDLMDLLDKEVNKVKNFYNDNKSIYDLIEDLEKLWNKMIIMQERANDPSRLWQNRGGQMLKEEKERKVIQKELPRVEKKLKHLLNVFEKTEGKYFLYYDERLLDVIDNQSNKWKSSKMITHQTKSKLQSGIRPQTFQIVTRSRTNTVTTSSSNQASKVHKMVMDNKTVVTKENLDSKKHIMLLTSPPKNVLREHNHHCTTSRKPLLETYVKESQIPVPCTPKTPVPSMPRGPLIKTPVKGSHIPIPRTPTTPVFTTPRSTPNVHTVTKPRRTSIIKKLPIIF